MRVVDHNPLRTSSGSVVLLGFSGQALVVDCDELAEPEPRVVRFGLDSPGVLGCLFAGRFCRTEQWVGILALPRLIGIHDLLQLVTYLMHRQRRPAVPDHQERYEQRALDHQRKEAYIDRST